ncbi:ATP-grasp domain-containing protein [Candidatus Uabimicrobium amorphum]|uniref:Putative alpha-L-glutamate ligase n=1 Tax=Uabimicrobium amorphum TaxID=2596890 RepID=A0A5S9IHM8_UABAM|nr:RimK family alpha-L-glutamate ligase [Candidatus Uabimicrobium amorphum]BBM81989.1 putative alpha-L-glutamate ligase [Candidatus Uabimicrobium amorphum]
MPKKIALINCVLSENPLPDFHLYFQKIAGEKHGVQVDIHKNGALTYIVDGREKILYDGEEIEDYDLVFSRFAIRSVHSADYYVLRAFENRNIPVINPTYSIIKAKDKLFTLQTLAHHKLPVTPSLVVRNHQQLRAGISLIDGPPYIIKNCFGSGGKNILLAYDKAQLMAMFDYTWVRDRNAILLVQPFLRSEQNHEDIRAVTLGFDTHYAMIRTATKEEYRTNISVGGSVCATQLSEEEKKMCTIAAKAMNLPFCGIDFIRTKDGPVILEVNSCPGLEGIAKAHVDINIFEKVVDFVCTYEGMKR